MKKPKTNLKQTLEDSNGHSPPEPVNVESGVRKPKSQPCPSCHGNDFERLVQLAEFGARRHDERRQVEFRIFIAYNTLLVLAFYQIDKIAELNSSALVIGGLGLIHFVYLMWEVRLSRALLNDAWRRNFYLKKAECILDHLQRDPDSPFSPKKDVYVTISPAAELKKKSNSKKDDKISEYELFENHEPYIILVPSMLEVRKREFWTVWVQILTDWSRPFQVIIPTVMLGLLIFALLQKC